MTVVIECQYCLPPKGHALTRFWRCKRVEGDPDACWRKLDQGLLSSCVFCCHSSICYPISLAFCQPRSRLDFIKASSVIFSFTPVYPYIKQPHTLTSIFNRWVFYADNSTYLPRKRKKEELGPRFLLRQWLIYQLQCWFKNTIIRTVEVQPTMTMAIVKWSASMAELSCASAATIPDATRNTPGACPRRIRKIPKACGSTWRTTLVSTSIHLAVLDPEFIPEFEHWNVAKIVHDSLTSHFLTAREPWGDFW